MRPTRDEILSEPAGARMNRWVGELVMGCREKRKRHHDGWLYDLVVPGGVNRVDFCEPGACWSAVPNYSEDIATAWKVVDRLLKRFTAVDVAVLSIGVACCSIEQCTGEIGEKYVAVEEAGTAPLAICRAALLATTTP